MNSLLHFANGWPRQPWPNAGGGISCFDKIWLFTENKLPGYSRSGGKAMHGRKKKNENMASYSCEPHYRCHTQTTWAKTFLTDHGGGVVGRPQGVDGEALCDRVICCIEAVEILVTWYDWNIFIIMTLAVCMFNILTKIIPDSSVQTSSVQASIIWQLNRKISWAVPHSVLKSI